MDNREAVVSVVAIGGAVFLLCFLLGTMKSCQDNAGFERDACRQALVEAQKELSQCERLCRSHRD